MFVSGTRARGVAIDREGEKEIFYSSSAAPAHMESPLIEKVKEGDFFFKFVSGTCAHGVPFDREGEKKISSGTSAKGAT